MSYELKTCLKNTPIKYIINTYKSYRLIKWIVCNVMFLSFIMNGPITSSNIWPVSRV